MAMALSNAQTDNVTYISALREIPEYVPGLQCDPDIVNVLTGIAQNGSAGARYSKPRVSMVFSQTDMPKA